MFITSSKVICRVVDGFKDKRQESLEDIEEVLVCNSICS